MAEVIALIHKCCFSMIIVCFFSKANMNVYMAACCLQMAVWMHLVLFTPGQDLLKMLRVYEGANHTSMYSDHKERT